MTLHNALENSQFEFSAESLQRYFYNRDTTEDEIEAFSSNEWQRAVRFSDSQRTHGHLITGYDFVLFPSFLNDAFTQQKLCLFLEQDYPAPTYCYIETAEDIFFWEQLHKDKFQIVGWDEVIQKKIRPAYEAVKDTEANLLYQGVLCPLENVADGVGIILEAMYLIDPTYEQISAVEKHVGKLEEDELFGMLDEVREQIRQSSGYEKLKHCYQENRRISGTSWV